MHDGAKNTCSAVAVFSMADNENVSGKMLPNHGKRLYSSKANFPVADSLLWVMTCFEVFLRLKIDSNNHSTSIARWYKSETASTKCSSESTGLRSDKSMRMMGLPHGPFNGIVQVFGTSRLRD